MICPGHESTDGPIGNTVYCDGTCQQAELPSPGGMCDACGSDRIELLGALGRRLHFRCKMCWWEWSRADYN